MRLNPRRVLRTLWIIAGLSSMIWLYFGFQALSVAEAAVESDQDVAITETVRGLKFQPRANAQAQGLIFLPGGMVEPIAYAPLLRRIARAGYSSYLVYLPMRCACTGSQVSRLFADLQRVLAGEDARRWVLARHSRGGMLASRFVHEEKADLAGLVLIATTHPRDYSLAERKMPVTKIYGSRDGVASYEQMRENRHLLPPDTTWIRIDGGNHVQFGYYRYQLGDGDATISREEQQELLANALLKALSSANQTRAGSVDQDIGADASPRVDGSAPCLPSRSICFSGREGQFVFSPRARAF